MNAPFCSPVECCYAGGVLSTSIVAGRRCVRGRELIGVLKPPGQIHVPHLRRSLCMHESSHDLTVGAAYFRLFEAGTLIIGGLVPRSAGKETRRKAPAVSTRALAR